MNPTNASAVTVVLRTLNRPRLLQRALRSIAAQTRPADLLVVVNDGGEQQPVDDAVTAIEWADTTKVQVVHNDQPSGRGGALVDGLAHARGEYFVIHDDDDAWEPDFLELTTHWLDNHEDDVAVATRTWVVFEAEREGELVEVSREVLAAETDAITLIDTAQRNDVPPIALLFRREAVERVGGFDPELPALEDWDLLLRLLHDGSIELLPGEPKALWYHRTEAEGAESNSVYADSDQHRDYAHVITDRYARRDVQLGDLLASGVRTNRLEKRFDSLAALAQANSMAQAEHLETVQLAIGQEVAAFGAQIAAVKAENVELREEIRGLRHAIEQMAKALERSNELTFGATVSRGMRRMQRRIEREPASGSATAASSTPPADDAFNKPNRWLDAD